MVIDSSVLIAILNDEPDRELLQRAINADPVRLVSAVTKLESGIVVFARHGPIGARQLDQLLAAIGSTIVGFNDEQAEIGRDAFARFGKGRHRAGLNFGDCATYALAVSAAEPLLFKGTDFHLTGVRTVEVPRAG